MEMLENTDGPTSTSDARTRTNDYPFLGEGVQLDLKLNVQCPEGDVVSTKLSALMGALELQVHKVAAAVMDELLGLPRGEAELTYPTSRKMRLANDGTCAYLLLELVTTRVVTYPAAATLVEHIVTTFVEKASQLMLVLDKSDDSVLQKALAGLEDWLRDPDCKLSDLIGTGVPHLGDRA